MQAPIGSESQAADARESLRMVLAASVVTLLLWFVPFVGLALYPVRLFVTYVHELCHAIGALLTLGWAHEIEIYANGSGVTLTSGGLGLVVASAGYVGTTLVGAALLLLAARRRTVAPALATVGVVFLVSAVALGGNLLAWIAGLGLGGALVALAAKARPGVARFALSFLAIQCMLNALSDLKYLFYLSVAGPAQTDAQNMATATGGLVPAVVWTLLWSVLALAALAAAVRLYYVVTVKRHFPGGF